MKKRILSLLLALVMVLVLVPTVALAEDTPAMSGTCGASGNENNVKWELTDVDGDGNYTLTISGTGAMADYTGWQSQPWKGYANQITRFVVEDGVTNISKFATNGETKIEEYIIGKDVAEIGTFGVSADSAKEFVVDSANTSFKVADGAILTADGTTLVAYPGGRASVEEYAIPSTVTTILGGAFNGADMQRLLVPNSVKSIPNWSFQGCSAAYVEINMEDVPGYAFTNFLSALKELRFREDVKTIDRHAFGFISKDGSLEKVKFESSELPKSLLVQRIMAQISTLPIWSKQSMTISLVKNLSLLSLYDAKLISIFPDSVKKQLILMPACKADGDFFLFYCLQISGKQIE